MRPSKKNKENIAKSRWEDLVILAKKSNNYELFIDFFEYKIGMKSVSKKMKVMDQYKLYEKKTLKLIDDYPSKALLLQDEYFAFLIEKICFSSVDEK